MREFRTYGSVGEALGNRRFYPEVEIFAGAVEAMGKEDAIPTPVNSTFFNLIRVMESN